MKFVVEKVILLVFLIFEFFLWFPSIGIRILIISASGMKWIWIFSFLHYNLFQRQSVIYVKLFEFYLSSVIYVIYMKSENYNLCKL